VIRFSSLGSGSRGNATIIEAGSTRIMLDCGFSETRFRKRLALRELEPSQIDAILVTHEHSDHINGVGAVARKHNIPVYMTRGTASQEKHGVLSQLHYIDVHDCFSIGDIEIQAYPVPHDACEPVQFVFSDGSLRLGVLTDVGSPTQHIVACLNGCDALILECNHDVNMLAKGPYPEYLKARVGGHYGHLNNRQAADLLRSIDTSSLQHIVAAHISDKNNTEEIACAALAEALSCHESEIIVADQEQGLNWLTVASR